MSNNNGSINIDLKTKTIHHILLTISRHLLMHKSSCPPLAVSAELVSEVNGIFGAIHLALN